MEETSSGLPGGGGGPDDAGTGRKRVRTFHTGPVVPRLTGAAGSRRGAGRREVLVLAAAFATVAAAAGAVVLGLPPLGHSVAVRTIRSAESREEASQPGSAPVAPFLSPSPSSPSPSADPEASDTYDQGVLAGVPPLATLVPTVPRQPQGYAAVVKGFAYKCVDGAQADSSPVIAVQLHTCDGTDAEKWWFGDDGSVREFGKCLSAAPGGGGNRTPVQLRPCDGGPGQKWQWKSDEETLVNKQSGRCLDDTDGKPDDGNPLQLWDCVANSNQRWHVDRV